MQEERLEAAPAAIPLDRFRAAAPPEAPQLVVAEAAASLSAARGPLVLIGRVSNQAADWDRRVALVERLGARVLTDLKNGAGFPTAHAAHPFPPGLFVAAEAASLVRDADVILALDWIDLGGTLKQACAGRWPAAKVINCSLDQYVHNGWSMDYQALPAADLSVLAAPDAFVSQLLQVIGPGVDPAADWPDATPQPAAPDTAAAASSGGRLSVEALAAITIETLAGDDPSYIRLPLGWPGQQCRFKHPLDYIGFDGGGGIGSGPGMAVGAAIALRGTARLPVAVLGDGDYLMGLTAIWTAVHYAVPLLIIVGNNASFFNDELHQERVARMRSRPVENRSIGLRMEDPPLNLATLAAGQGAIGIGPVATQQDFARALAQAARAVRDGAVVVIDAHVAPEYARGMSSALLRNVPAERQGRS